MRPSYGNAFEFDRVLNVFFYTSNIIKLLQARLMFSRYGYELKHFSGNREPYDENYELGTDLLLGRAIEQVNKAFGFRSIFFVEDTSLRIEALSDQRDFPGLAVKEWFESRTFHDVDAQIRARGSDRRATVKSDIALHVPSLGRPLFFHGETAGTIAPSAPAFQESAQYPWLTPLSFNGWFVPNGSNKRLGEMEFEESLEFDFRAKSLRELIIRIEELNAGLNLRPQFYTVRRVEDRDQAQLSIFAEEGVLLIVIGHKCAGKTTLSDHVAFLDGAKVFEASTILRELAKEAGVDVETSDEAFDFLRIRGWDSVAVRIAEYVDRAGSNFNVISGLRTPEELLHLKKKFPNARIVFIEADVKDRFERHVRRGRDQHVKTIRNFEAQDEAQMKFGVMRVATELSDITINNNGTIESYKRRIDELIQDPRVSGNQTSLRPTSNIKPLPTSELHRCLLALRKIGRAETCENISAVTAEFGVRVRKYNTNRALKDVPEFAHRITVHGKLLHYQITPRGEALLDLIAEGRR